MGSGYSEPIQSNPDLGFVAIALRRDSKVRLIHAPPEVVNATARVVTEVDTACGYDGDSARITDKCGAIQIKMRTSPFETGYGKTDATAGKMFCVRMFEELHKLGYEPVVSSDLSRFYDQATWFFRKISPERPVKKVICLAPGQTDRLVVMRGNDRFISTLKLAIEESWSYGIQREKSEESCGETLHEFKLNGNPWLDKDAGESNVICRQMLVKIFGRLGEINYKLLMGTNIKGGTDSMFFIHDPDYRASPADFCMISLNKMDRIRLVNCNEIANLLRHTIVQHFPIQREEEKYGSHEFKLEGYAWHCSGHEAIASRRLISALSATMLSNGWALSTAIDLSRSLNDKSVLLYIRSQAFSTNFACVALSDVDTIRLLSFPDSVSQALREIVSQNYSPGIQEEKQKESDCYQIKLNHSPWSQSSGVGIHARSMLTHLMNRAGQLGWRVVASADVSAKYVTQDNGPDYPIDVHSWYLVHWPSS